jgi:hypothetical protein
MLANSLEQLWMLVWERNQDLLEYHDLLPGEFEIFIVGSEMGGIKP